jgi:hypothetical protein
MDKKVLIVVIAFLLGVIGYQSGILDSFLQKGIKCDSSEATSLAKEIAINKIIKPLFAQMGDVEYHIDSFNINTIITKKYDKETGYHECNARSSMIGTFKFPKATNNMNPKMFFKLVFGSDDVTSLGNDKYKIVSPVSYSTEITDNKEQYFVKLKFDGARTIY